MKTIYTFLIFCFGINNLKSASNCLKESGKVSKTNALKTFPFQLFSPI